MNTFLKRLILLALCLAALSSPAALAAEAETPADTAKADVLNELGLFNGRETNADGTPVYALEDTASRIEGLVMLIRLLGEEGDALAYTGECPFTDVPAWAERHAAYAYSKGYVTGVTSTTYEPDRQINGHQYTVLILRALGYTEADGDFTYSEARVKAAEVGLLEDAGDHSGDFCRGDIVSLSHRALTTGTKEGRYLSTQLAEKIGTEEFTEILAKHALAEPEPGPRTVRVDYPSGYYMISLYDADGTLLQQTNYNSNGTMFRDQIYEYSAAGNLQRRYKYEKDGVMYEYEIEEYDEKEQLLKLFMYTSVVPPEQEDQWRQCFEYEYDANGTRLGWKGYGPGYVLQFVTECDEQGARAKQTFYNIETGKIQDITVYDENGHSQTMYDNTGKVSGTRKYDEKSCMLEWTIYNNGKFVCRWVYEYNENRTVARQLGYRSSGALDMLIENDANGTQLRTTHYYETGEVESVIEYDAKGQMKLDTNYDRSGIILSKTEYNANGIPVLQTAYYNTGEVKAILEHDGAGEVIRSTHYDRDGSILRVVDSSTPIPEK